jgi:hypothetical protein
VVLAGQLPEAEETTAERRTTPTKT